MRFRLLTLLIVLALGPLVMAWAVPRIVGALKHRIGRDLNSYPVDDLVVPIRQTVSPDENRPVLPDR